MIPRLPVTFQMVVQCHPGDASDQLDYHLFEMDFDKLPTCYVGMKLAGVPGVPNVVGPAASYDNAVMNVVYDGKHDKLLTQVMGYKDPTKTVDEIKQELPEWQYKKQLIMLSPDSV